MSDHPKLVELEQPDDLRAACEALKRSLPVYTEYMVEIAKIRRASYEAHLAEGFTESQALELCKSMML